MKIWILCPNLRGARLFYADRLADGIRYVQELPRPTRLIRSSDFLGDEDVPEVTEEPRDLAEKTQVAESYSQELSHFLTQALQRQNFEGLIVCAESHLLEILEKKLDSPVRSKLLGTVDLDLYNVNESDLINYVRDIINKIPGFEKFEAA